MMTILRAAVLIAVLVSSTNANAQLATLPPTPTGCVWRQDLERGFELLCPGRKGVMSVITTPASLDPNTQAKADAGDGDAMLALVDLYGRSGGREDAALTLSWLQKAAATGQPDAIFTLASFYAEGHLVPKSDAKALEWYRAGAAVHDSRSMNAIAEAYASGRGAPADEVEAIRWFEMAADHGSRPAMQTLALRYAGGLGVPQDLELAARWRALAENYGRWAVGPTGDSMLLVYPMEAAAAHVQGRVVLTCVVAADRSLSDCSVTRETPRASGFADAALSLINSVRQNAAVPPGARISVPFIFKMEGFSETRVGTDQCAAYAVAQSKTKTGEGAAGWFGRYWPARADYLALRAGQAANPERLAPQIADAAAELAAGKGTRVLRGCNLI